MRTPAHLIAGFMLLGAVASAQNLPPVVSITSPAPGSVILGPTTIQLQASATSSDATIVNVTFSDGGAKIATVAHAPYTYSWKNVAVGGHSLTATATDSLGFTTTTVPTSITVIQDVAPTVTLTAPLNGAALLGTTAPLSAMASSSDATIVSVAFLQGTTKVGTVTVPKNGAYSFSWTKVQPATYTLTAVATDSVGVSTTSAPVTITVNAGQFPTVALTSPANGFTTLGPATVPLTATASSPDEPIVSVAFFDGTKKIATSKVAPYAFNDTKVQPGIHAFTAVATDAIGLSTTSAIVSVTVNQDPSPVVSITSPSNGSSFVGPATIGLSASASSASENVVSVEYLVQGASSNTPIATTKAPFNFTWRKVAASTYNVIAIATDTLGVTGTSSPVTLTVNPDQAPSVSIVSPIAGAIYVAPASVELQANPSSPDTTISSVEFLNGSSVLATVSKVPYAFDLKNLAAGSYTIVAQVTDGVGTTATSAPMTFSVTSSTTSTIKITAPTNGKIIASPATVSLAASATAPAGVASVGYYAGGTLIGTATSSPYSFTWQNVPTGVYYLTAVETDTLGAGITSAPVTFTSDTAPSVTLSTPGAQSTFALPGVVNLTASATTSGIISKVQFFQGATLLGTATTAPYQFTWTGMAAGTYSLTAKATDNLGVVGVSPAISLTVLNDPGPVVTLLNSPASLVVPSTSEISLNYSVNDSAASILKVEIYREGTLVATLTNPISGSTWSFTEQNPLPIGSYAYFARAYDGAGISAESSISTALSAPVPPYSTDFEVGDGFTLGPLAGQVGWSVSQGSANVSGVAFSGSQSVQLVAGSPVAVAQDTFAAVPNETIIFCDFWAEPVAETAIASSTLFTAEQAEFGFQQANGQGVLQVFSGNGNGGGSWTPTSFTIPLSSTNQAQSWVHLTARLDFTKKTWDIYANGNLIAYDIPFVSSSSTYFSLFQIQGDASTDSFIDELSVVPTNPLFADVNNDGINDAWESQYGLSLATNDRYLNLSGDGIPVIQDYVTGANPLVNTKVTPDPVASGLVLHLRADAAVVADSNGNVSQWLDQSGNNNSAFQATLSVEPKLVSNQLNGLPSIAFNGANSLSLPYNTMQNAPAGEIIGVVFVANNPSQFSMLWNFGTGFGSSYASNQHFDDFGTSDTSSVPELPSEIGQYFIYDTAISSAGTSIYSDNGVPEWTRSGLPVGFQLFPDIGGYGTGSFIGNISEVMVYNRVLTAAERMSVGTYLQAKYAIPAITVPNAPTDLLAAAVSSDAVDLSWTVSNPAVHTVATISRETGSGGFTTIAQVSDASSYTDTGLSPGVSYTYHIALSSYAGSSGASNPSTVTTPASVADIPTQGLSLWLRSTAGTEGAGPLTMWIDQSSSGNNAVPVTGSSPPQVVEGQVNGLPVVRFAGANALGLPANMLQTAQAGQILAIVKIPVNPGQANSLWNFGTGFGTTYTGTTHLDDFGTSDTSSTQEPTSETSQYFIYDTAVDTTGKAVFRYNGSPEWIRTGLAVGFQPFPDLGGYGNGNLFGDIAEVLVYNRVLAAPEQATVYGYLAAKYSMPGVVGNLSAPVISSSLNATGAKGAAFSYQISASGTPASFGATGLPPGLSLNAGTGVISGTPTTPGSSAVTISATNAAGTGSAVLTITINPPLPVITSSPTATGQVSFPFNYQIVASNGASSFAASGLPGGLSVDPIAGLISGTPTAAGTFGVSLTATNATGSTTAALSLTINPPPPSLTSPSSASGQLGAGFSYQVVANNGAASYSAAGLPPGLAINTSTGLISGIPTSGGTFTVTLTIPGTYGTGTATLTLSISSNFVVTNGLLTWLRADSGVTANTNGNVSQWSDQSALGNSAFQSTASSQPLLVLNQASGNPIIRFNGTSSLNLPIQMMQGAQGGQIIAVVKVASDPNSFNSLWEFGSGFGSSYFNNIHFDDFGSSDESAAVVETASQISQYYVYDSSIDPTGDAIYRYDGTAVWSRDGLQVGFNSSPVIGSSASGGFVGDIAEILVFDRVLTAQEQASVYGYLASRYAMPLIATAIGSPALTSAPAASGQVGSAFSYQITADNNPTGFAASNLPPGLAVSAAGLISGTPTSAGVFPSSISASNASGTGSTPLSISVGAIQPTVTSSSSASGQVGTIFDYQITATNGATSFGAIGLPAGLAVDPVGGIISGTPQAAGTSTVTLTATNSGGSGTEILTLTIVANTSPSITSAAGASGQVGVPFTYQIAATNTPTGFGATSLPAGLSVDPVAGLISGTPQSAGTSTVTLSATNANGTGTETLTLTVSGGSGGSAPPSITSATVASGQLGNAFSYQITATGNPTSFGATGLPGGLAINPSTGLVSGSPTATGTSTVTISAMNPSGTGTATLTITVGTMYTSGMVLWLEGDNGVTVAGSNSVTQWADQSGLGNNATQTATAAPSLVPNSIDGHAVVHFTAANSQYMQLPALLAGLTQGEVFAVFRSTSNKPALAMALYEFGAGFGSEMPNTDGQLYDDFLNTSKIQMGPPSVSLTSFNLYNVSAAPGQWTSRLDGALLYATTSNGFQAPTRTLLLGANAPFSIADFFDGDIAELIVYNQVLTSQQRTLVGQYLQAKYQLPAIPVPSAPTALAATAISSTQVSLTWNDSAAADGVTYSILRSTGGGAYSAVGQISNAQSYIDTQLSAGTTYNYEVVSQSYAGSSGSSNAATVTTMANGTDIPLSAMQLWLRADAGLDNGSVPVSYWRDQSGLGNDATQLKVSAEPTLEGGVINGRPAVHFTATNSNYMNLPAFMASMTQGEVFVVFRMTTDIPATPQALYMLAANNGPTELNTNGNIYDSFLNSSLIQVGTPLVTLTSFNLYDASAAPGQWMGRMNGATLISTTSNVIQAPTSSLILGGTITFGVNGFLDGDIAELIVFNQALTPPQRSAVAGYLQNKYFPAVVVPSAPVGLTATLVSATQINLVWVPDVAADGYAIQRNVNGGSWQTIATLTGPASAYSDNSVPAGNVIKYRIQELGYSGYVSAFSASALVFPNPSAIDPTNGFTYAEDAELGIDPTNGNDSLPTAPSAPASSTPPSESQSVNTPPTVILVSPSQATLQ